MTLRLTLISTFLLVAVLLISCEQATLPTRAPVAATTAPEKATSPYPGSAAPAPASLQQTRAVSERATPAATATPTPWQVAAAPAVPGELVTAAQELVAAHPAKFVWSESDAADVYLRMEQDGTVEPLATWTYAVAVPFATVADGTTLANLQASWREEAGVPPLLTPDTAALLQELWGEGAATIVAEPELETALWTQRAAWTLVPYHQLMPSYKVWEVDGLSPLAMDFAPASYPLVVDLGLDGDPEAVRTFAALWPGHASNRDPQKITRVAMTGVTALVRATAYQMEIRGMTYPGEEVAPVMQGADIAHVSNEVAFVPDCPMPHYIGGTTFCSSPRYMELLQFIGVDVVELTGNHVNDWGAGYIPYTLQLYENAGMQVFWRRA
jgi:hypothetical protein